MWGSGGVDVDAFEEGVDLDVGLGGGGQGPLGPVAGGAETTEGGLVALHRGSLLNDSCEGPSAVEGHVG